MGETEHFSAARAVLDKAASQCPELLVLSLATIGGMGRINLIDDGVREGGFRLRIMDRSA